MMEQEYTSAKSSIKQVPAGFKIVDKHFGWKPNTLNLDIGGGKFDLMTSELSKKSVTNLVYDPYNRSEEHNLYVLQACRQFGMETVTVFNVLNVIKERNVQLEVIWLAFRALQDSGMVFIRSTYMNPNKVSGPTKSGTYQHYKTQKEYLEIVKEVFPNAELKYGLIYGMK